MKSSAITEMLTEIERYPYFLFLSNLSSIDNEIAALPWNCVFTTLTDVNAVESLFKLPNRQCKIISNPEDFRKMPNRKNTLNIVFIFGTSSIENESPLDKVKLKSNISRYFEIIPDLLSQFGHIVFDTDNLHEFIKDKLEELIFNLRKKTVIFFNANSDLSENEIYSIFEVVFIKSTLKASLSYEDLSLYKYRNSSLDSSDKQVDFFINKKRFYKSYTQYSDFFKNFYILTENKINEISVPDYLQSNYFYLFLQNSANDYSWYGYQNAFNFIRDEDLKILETVRNSLSKTQQKKTILLYGQAGSGKTVTTNYVAYKIFEEHVYPVIYLKRNQIDFLKDDASYFTYGQNHSNTGFAVLDDFMKDLEDQGAKNILLVWDLSLYSDDYHQVYEKLSKYLHNRGRNFVLFCTGYAKNNNSKPIIQIELQPVVSTNKTQIDSFIRHLETYADLSSEEISNISNYICNNDNELNLFSIFYRFFAITRPALTYGIKKEAEVSIDSVLAHCKDSDTDLSLMQLALKKAGLINEVDLKKSISISNEDIQNLLIITAICCKYNVSLPTSLALKILPELNLDLIKTITSIPFFIFSEEDDDFSFSIRNSLDAIVLLNAFYISPEMYINRICQLIEKANLFSSSYNANREIKCIADLLHRIGPSYQDAKREYINYYNKIIETLRSLHEYKGKIDNRIILIEMNYIREFYTDKLGKGNISREEFENAMKEIISLGESYSAVSNSSKDFYFVMIKIETANARYTLAKNESEPNLNQLYNAKTDAEAVFALYDNQYSYTIWFQACNKIYDITSDKDILKQMLNKIELLKAENEDIDEDRFLANEFNKVHEKLSGTSDDYIAELIKNGNPNGIYLKAMKFLQENNLNMNNHNSVTSCQFEKYKELEKSVFSSEYLPIFYKNSECLWLYIKLKWLLYNGRPFFMGDKELTCISIEHWNEILELCKQYLIINSDEKSERFNIVVEYLEALCYAQTGNYGQSLSILTNLRERAESYYLLNRVYSRHMLCNEQGEIINFSGRVRIAANGKISILINQINSGNPLFCNRNNLRNFQPENGKTDDHFQVGIGIMGFSVFHGYNGGKND